jgi:hypothetical protein
MITVAWLEAAAPGVALYRWCRGPCESGFIFSAPSGSKQEDFMDFPALEWDRLQDGHLPDGLSRDDISALVEHMRQSGHLYSSEAQTALKAAEKAPRRR